MIARFLALSLAVHTGTAVVVGHFANAPDPAPAPLALQLSLAADSAAGSETSPVSDDATSGTLEPVAGPTPPDPRRREPERTEVTAAAITSPETEAVAAAAVSREPERTQTTRANREAPVQPVDDHPPILTADSTADSAADASSDTEPTDEPGPPASTTAASEANATADTPAVPEPARIAKSSRDPAITPAMPPADTGASTASDTVVNHARAELAALLASRFVYPPLARSRGWEGRVELEIELRGDGSISTVRIVRSSGHRLLDRDAVRTLERIGAVPGAAQWLQGRDLAVALPVIYRLVEG